MKLKHWFFLSILFVLGACSKDSEPSKTDLLAKNWQIDEIQASILGFKGTIYKKGAATNTEDFSKVRFNFRKDGTMDLISNDGTKATTLWKFANNETQVEIITPGAPNQVLKVINLTSNNFDSDTQLNNNGQVIDATFKMIPE